MLLSLTGQVSTVSAATRTWGGGGANNNWTTSANWDAAVVAGDSLVFPLGAARLSNTNDFAGGTTFNSITFSGTNYILSGNAFTLSAGITNNAPTNVNNQVSCPITLAANQAFSSIFSQTSALQLNGPVTNAGHTLTFIGGTFIVSGVISGAGGIESSAGFLGLTAANTYAGTTHISSGFVAVANGSALGDTNTGTTVDAGATLGVELGISVPEPITLAGTLQNLTVTNTLTGNIMLTSANATVDVSTNTTLTLSGALSGSGGLTKTSAGTLTLSGTNANTYTGATRVNAGTLLLGKTGGATAINTTSGSLIIGDGLGGADSDVVRYSAAGQIGSAFTSVTIASSGLLDVNGFMDQSGPLTLNGGHVTTGAGVLGLVSVTNNANTNRQGLISGNIRLPGGTILFDTEGHFFSPDLNVQASVIGTGSLTKAGPGEMVLSSSNSFTGSTTVNAGELEVDNSFGLGATNGAVVVNSGAALLVRFNSAISNKSLTINGPGAGGALLPLTGSHGTNSWSGDITLASDAVIGAFAASDRLILSGAIGGPGGLTIQDPGTVVFSGTNANTYSGATTVSSGTLLLSRITPNVSIPGVLIVGDGVGGADADVVQITGFPALRTNTAVTVNSSGLLRLSTFSESIGSLAGSGHVDSAGGTLDAGFDNTSTTFSGVISGSGGFAKDGNGTLTLSGTNTYTGSTTVATGKLIINGSQPQSPVTMGGGTLGGSGVVGITFVGGAAISPGASPGILTTSNLTLNGSGNTPADFIVELNGPAPGTGYDQLRVNGSVNLNATRLIATLGFLSAISNSFVIIDNRGSIAVAGTFEGLFEGATVDISGTPFRITYTGGDGNDVVLTQLTATQRPLLTIQPVPGTNVVLSWATNFTGYTLEANTNFATNNWVTVTNPPAISGTNNTVTNASGGANRFYRLRAP